MKTSGRLDIVADGGHTINITVQVPEELKELGAGDADMWIRYIKEMIVGQLQVADEVEAEDLFNESALEYYGSLQHVPMQ